MVSTDMLDEISLRDAAIVYLSRFLATKLMLRRTLERKIYRWKSKMIRLGENEDKIERQSQLLEPMINQIITDMVRLGAVSDKEYVMSQLRHQFSNGMSSQAIRAHCQSKGVDNAVIDEMFDAFFEEQSSSLHDAEIFAALRRLYKKRLGPFMQKNNHKTEHGHQEEKSLRTLASSGFSYSTACEVLDFSYEEAQEFIQSHRRIFW